MSSTTDYTYDLYAPCGHIVPTNTYTLVDPNIRSYELYLQSSRHLCPVCNLPVQFSQTRELFEFLRDIKSLVGEEACIKPADSSKLTWRILDKTYFEGIIYAIQTQGKIPSSVVEFRHQVALQKAAEEREVLEKEMLLVSNEDRRMHADYIENLVLDEEEEWNKMADHYNLFLEAFNLPRCEANWRLCLRQLTPKDLMEKRKPLGKWLSIENDWAFAQGVFLGRQWVQRSKDRLEIEEFVLEEDEKFEMVIPEEVRGYFVLPHGWLRNWERVEAWRKEVGETNEIQEDTVEFPMPEIVPVQEERAVVEILRRPPPTVPVITGILKRPAHANTVGTPQRQENVSISMLVRRQDERPASILQELGNSTNAPTPRKENVSNSMFVRRQEDTPSLNTQIPRNSPNGQTPQQNNTHLSRFFHRREENPSSNTPQRQAATAQSTTPQRDANAPNPRTRQQQQNKLNPRAPQRGFGSFRANISSWQKGWERLHHRQPPAPEE